MRSSDPARPFTVVVADNFHYMDESENYEHGKFETLEAAIAASKRIVDEFLASAILPGMTADALHAQYTSFGDDPSVTFSDLLDEGLCFGWSESKRRKGEDGFYLQQFTPRKTVGTQSRRNRTRVKQLIKEGRMTKAGLKALGRESA